MLYGAFFPVRTLTYLVIFTFQRNDPYLYHVFIGRSRLRELVGQYCSRADREISITLSSITFDGRVVYDKLAPMSLHCLWDHVYLNCDVLNDKIYASNNPDITPIYKA